MNIISGLMAGGNVALATLLVAILRLPIVFFSLSLHESSHGYAAWKCGDPTARSLGRISLDPFKHFDPIGTLCMLLFGIGWAKPVPVNARYFKKPKRDFAIVAAAGPLSNLALALVSMIVMRVLDIIFLRGTYMVLSPSILSILFYSNAVIGEKLFLVLMYFLEMAAFMNIILAIFNLIPVPPFDGSRIAFAFLPDKYYFGVMKYERYIMIGFLILFYMFGDGLGVVAEGLFNLIYKGLSLITGFLA